MQFRQNKTGRATSMAKGFTIGAAVSIMFTLVSAFILAKLVDQEVLSWENIGYGVLASILIASFMGSWTSYRNIKHQRLLVCSISGILYWLLLLGISMLLYSGRFESVFVTAGIILSGSVCAFLVTAPKNNRRNYKKHRIVHR